MPESIACKTYCLPFTTQGWKFLGLRRTFGRKDLSNSTTLYQSLTWLDITTLILAFSPWNHEPKRWGLFVELVVVVVLAFVVKGMDRLQEANIQIVASLIGDFYAVWDGSNLETIRQNWQESAMMHFCLTLELGCKWYFEVLMVVIHRVTDPIN